jgi:hypothetical protein
MQKNEWLSLAPGQVNEVLWSLIGGKLADVPCPPKINQPQYDMRLSKRGAYIWASESDLETLNFYMKRAQAPNDNPAFAEKNKKDADSLAYFVRWRQAFPTAIWSGIRGRKGDPSVTAKAPAYKPEEHQWETKGTSSSIPRSDTTSTPSKGYVDEDYSAGDDIPF